MLYMTSLTAALIAGIFTGHFLRDKRHVSFDKITLGIIILLIFSLGFSIGSNRDLLNSLPTLGVDAALIASSAILFSVALVKIARKMVGLK
jgi:uncharacterized membrane protein YbjE (DUF340 family)